MSNFTNREKPFEYWRQKDGNLFSSETVRNWYIARAYVLNRLKNVAFGPYSKEHLQVVVTKDSPLMLSVVRHVALSAHYINYNESSGKNRTVIVMESANEDIFNELKKEEYLGNLPDFCSCSVFGSEMGCTNSFTDIELRIVKRLSEDDRNGAVVMSEDDVQTFLESSGDVFSIDTRKAVLADRIYGLGGVIDNLPAENIHCAKRYTLALDHFQYYILQKKIQPLINEAWEKDPFRVKNGLSSIFCTDCFETRAKEIEKCWTKGKRMAQIWEEHNEALSMSEHARWVVGMLILGYRPLTASERIQDERLFNDEKKQYRKGLKIRMKDPAHIDLCSYADLHRINPDDLKYDSFLMLAIPRILEKVSKEDSRRK